MGATAPVRVRPKQSLGQNFLVDQNIARNIVRSLDLRPGEPVVEIGPGQGALTGLIAAETPAFVAVEIDQRVVEDLRARFAPLGARIVQGDILKTDFAGLFPQTSGKIRVVGNIPYHLTSEILFKVFEGWSGIRDLTIMIQREVARRLMAAPGTKEYGILSVCTRFYGTPELLYNVSPNCFYPKPAVTSSVVRITIHDNLRHGVDERLFRSVVRTAFGKRRKTLRNCLKDLQVTAEQVGAIISDESLGLQRRAEELSVDQFAELTTAIQRILAQ
jgi:16S rRNA (adenine1518-N6/adenine1519-N6)-dimethyltransferase